VTKILKKIKKLPILLLKTSKKEVMAPGEAFSPSESSSNINSLIFYNFWDLSIISGS
jgi:hypothetical protein